MAKININLSQDDYSSLDLSTSTIKILNTVTSCTFDVLNNSVAATTSGTKEAITAATYTSSQDAYKCAAIIVPQTVASGTQFLSFEIGSGDNQKTLYAVMRVCSVH